MPSTDSSNRKPRLFDNKSASFHGKIPTISSSSPADLRRPKTMPDIRSEFSLTFGGSLQYSRPKLTKLLLNVTVQGSVGSVQVLLQPENTVGDLIAAALKQYLKECRRPILPSLNLSCFDLHYSQFSLESLERKEKLIELGSRNFYLCTGKAPVNNGGDAVATSSCSKEVDKVSKNGSVPCLKFMNFL